MISPLRLGFGAFDDHVDAVSMGFDNLAQFVGDQLQDMLRKSLSNDLLNPLFILLYKKIHGTA